MGKRKAEAAGLPARIEQQPASTSGTGPFVVYFPSRFEPNSGDTACEWQAYAHSERRNQYQLVARTKRQVDFVGTTASAEYSSALPCSYALGVFTRQGSSSSSSSSSGRLELMPAEGGKILRMEPRVRGEQYAPRDTVTAIEPGRLREANMRLVEEFGSQRRKRQLKAREAGKVEAAHVSAGGAVLGLIAGMGQAATMTKDEVIKTSLAHRNIPPHHPEATSAEEAYRADDLVPLSIRDSLEITKLFPAEDKPEYREQLKADGRFGAGYVLSRLAVLRTAGSQEQREERCRMLALLGHLLKLQTPRWGVLKSGAGGLEELAEKTKVAPSVLEGLLDLFYSEERGLEGAKYLLSKEKRSLMLGWILVLAVRLEQGCVLEPECLQALSDELKLRVLDVVARYRELGCVDIPVSASKAEGGRSRGYRISLMPQSAEPKTLADYFPALKLGGKKR
ncbi:DNA-directed RNA polymerase I subunit RPA49 [Chlorella sorokiniana]|uniref:DNA-directed RNA polymerase I subunit RPA49 n=1 Tax=Chlorella sorokiniana TaxID=3076 RepID=A0A2P6U154_CHLSO|nr:DNA-directed RNA polymerase I subunit RPA49 [Chlorella sorokiniana]|eukprot:PRW60044.1 DNA-directed RNA polymerase I subunit RPA49 [Chlorella sorokiniana]